MKKSLVRKTASLFMAAIMGVASSVCTPSMVVKAESATVTDAKEEIADVQEERVEQTEQTAGDEEIIDIEVMAGEVTIDSEHFPDENFRKYLSEDIDIDSNGVLSNDEITNSVCIYVIDKQISSLKGIEYFTELVELYCSCNNLSSLDVSKNTELKELNCSYNKLSSLDVSNDTKLQVLDCSRNNLSSLDVSNNTNLYSLDCTYNNLSSLDVSKNTELKGLYCSHNNLSGLDVSNDIKLEALDCTNNNLSSLDVNKNTELGDLKCSDNNLSSLEVSNNTNLYWLDCSYNNLSCLEVSNDTELEYLDCSYNNLSSLDVSKNTELSDLSCLVNNLSSLDVSKNPYLYWLDCSSNNLSSLDVSNNTKLEDLYCNGNNLSSLDVSKNTEIRNLSCFENYLSSLDVNNNTKLELLDCSYNNLSSLDVSNNTKLEELNCSKNNLSNLDVSNNTSLSLFCQKNKIKKITLGEKSISTIHCDAEIENGLELLDNGAVVYLYTELDNNLQYDLSRIPGMQVNEIKYIDFNYFDTDGNAYDESSYLSGSIINIVGHEEGFYVVEFLNGTNITVYYEYNPSLEEKDINPGIFVMIADKDHYVAGVATTCLDIVKNHFEYSWVAQDASGNFIQMSDWSKSEWIDWTPDKFGTYKIFAKVRVDGKDDQVYTTVGQFDYHPYIKGKCQMPYSAVKPGQPGYLIGVESYENPNQSYQFEMLILDCTLLAQNLPAWTYTTGKFTVPEGNAGWCVWNPLYGYYWTLFRVYDENGVLIDEQCYGFANVY